MILTNTETCALVKIQMRYNYKVVMPGASRNSGRDYLFWYLTNAGTPCKMGHNFRSFSRQEVGKASTYTTNKNERSYLSYGQ